MGWFLHRKSKKPAAKPARKSPASVTNPKWDPHRTLAGVKFLLTVAVVVTIVLGWRYGETFLTHYVEAHRSGPVTAVHVRLAAAPQWMPQKLAGDLQDLVAAQVDGNPLDGKSLDLALSALTYSPWVERVNRVQRLADGTIWVHASYRAPFALVRGVKGVHVVDAQGVRLPDRDDVKATDLPVIEGVVAAPRPEGQVWPGRDLQAGLELALLLGTQPYARQVTAIDVSARGRDWQAVADGKTRIVLWTDHGRDIAMDPHVRWGMPPGQGRAIEPDAAAKLASLLSLYNYQHRRSIHLPDRWADVSISSDAVFVKPSSVADQTRTTVYTWTR